MKPNAAERNMRVITSEEDHVQRIEPDRPKLAAHGADGADARTRPTAPPSPIGPAPKQPPPNVPSPHGPYRNPPNPGGPMAPTPHNPPRQPKEQRRVDGKIIERQVDDQNVGRLARRKVVVTDDV